LLIELIAIGVLRIFSRYIDTAIAGPEETEDLAANALRLIRIRLRTRSLAKITPASQANSLQARGKQPIRKGEKGSEPSIDTHCDGVHPFRPMARPLRIEYAGQLSHA
jgi:hypothetical protein